MQQLIRQFGKELVLTTTFVLLMLGCAKTPSSVTVPGIYKGTYARGTETIVISADGTFRQVFTRDGSMVYSNTGAWRIDRQSIFFEPFVMPDGVGDKRATAPQKLDTANGTWHGILPLIIFSDDDKYWIRKQEK